MRTATGRSGVTLGAVVTALAVLAAVVPTSAVARPDDGRLDGVVAGVLGQWVDTGPCPLRRLSDQLVRCDDLTGNGVPAPAHVPLWSGRSSIDLDIETMDDVVTQDGVRDAMVDGTWPTTSRPAVRAPHVNAGLR